LESPFHFTFKGIDNNRKFIFAKLRQRSLGSSSRETNARLNISKELLMAASFELFEDNRLEINQKNEPTSKKLMQGRASENLPQTVRNAGK